jgi:hypothetical protein
VRDKSSQIEVVHTRDESSQWSPECEMERLRSSIVNEMAPLVNNASNSGATSSHHQESHISSSNMDEMNSSYSFMQQQQQRMYDSSAMQNMADYSTTLIKDVNHHFEPVELIINRSESSVGGGGAMSSATYVREIEDFHTNNLLRPPLHQFEPVNLIFQKPFYRSGSLPPLVSRINYVKSSARSDFEHTDSDIEEYYYYADRSSRSRHHQHHNNYYDQGFLNTMGFGGVGLGGESKMTYYKGSVEKRASRPTFKPVELILDASSVISSSSDHQYYSGKRYRDKSLPSMQTMMSRTIRRSRGVPIKHKNLVTSSFIYDNNSTNTASYDQYDYDYDYGCSDSYDLDYSISDFVSDQQQHHHRRAADRDVGGRYAAYKSLVTTEESRQKVTNNNNKETKYPTMEMTIDLKAPPTIDSPLSNITVYEGQSARMECILSGNDMVLFLRFKRVRGELFEYIHTVRLLLNNFT